MNSSFYLTAQTGFIVLTFVYFYFFLSALIKAVGVTVWAETKKRSYRFRIIAIPFAVLIFVSAWSLSGMMADFTKFPFNFLPVIAIPLLVALYVTFHHGFNEVLHLVPKAHIVKLQSFRFFVEILLWMLVIDGLLPEQMSFEGRNLDILTGITAPLVAWLIARAKISRVALIIWNVLCLGLLINIVTIAILSTPSPIRIFMEEPSNTIVAYFPFSLLPGLLVPLAYTLHFLSLRQLFMRSGNAGSD